MTIIKTENGIVDLPDTKNRPKEAMNVEAREIFTFPFIFLIGTGKVSNNKGTRIDTVTTLLKDQKLQ